MSTPTCHGGGKTGNRRRRPSSKCSAHRSSPRSKPILPPPQDATSKRLQNLLQTFPDPFPSLQVVRPIGEGTFSTVYLASRTDDFIPDYERDLQPGRYRCRYALKYLIPTSSPERIWMEVECLRLAAGKSNVVPLLFVHRSLGDVVLAMPYIETSKFSEVIKTMDFVEMKLYIKNLLFALAHIHSLGIIHRDVKPANFLYDRKRSKFGLVDFGLAQRSSIEIVTKEITIPTPVCKRKLTSSDLANSMESPPPSKLRKRNSSAADNCKFMNSPRSALGRKTPTKNVDRPPTSQFYDRRGSLLSQKKQKSSHSRPISEDDVECEESCEEKENIRKTPIKNRLTEHAGVEGDHAEVRRSPRKHPGSRTPGFAKLTITGSAIVQQNKTGDDGSAKRTTTTFSRNNSFTILDPASGIPSDLGTPKLQASLTSRHSFMTGNLNGKNSTGNLESFVVGPSQSTNSVTKKPSFQRFNTPSLIDLARCDCYGRPRICTKCSNRRSQKAARAGTPGFRPPEVLLKSEHQTTSVDTWAAGVILLCIISRTYPFFRAPDDITALAEVTALFGTVPMMEAASQYDKKFLCSENIQPVDLKTVCEQLAARLNGTTEPPPPSLVSSESLDLLKKLLKLFAHERITAEEALKHPFFSD